MPNKQSQSFEDLKQLVMTALEDMKAVDIVEIDVNGKTSVTDLMVIASGTSSRHVKSIAANVALDAKKQGNQALGVEGDEQGEWVLVDLGDIIVHVMQPHVRQFYDLEKLWNFDEAAAES